MKFELRSITKKFVQGDGSIVTIFEDATATFHTGMSYAITGVSGTGKSTLLYMLAGIEKPSSGAIMYNNSDITVWGSRNQQVFLLRSVGLLFQQPYLIQELSVIDNVTLKGRIAGLSESELSLRGRDLLESVGLAHKAQQSPAVLSGGEQQRVALARALFLKPQFLLADEPTAHLDQNNKKRIIELLCVMQKEYGMGLIMSTHDQTIAQCLQEQYEIKNGRLGMCS
ncbi:MAG: ATP-binding cassette domain-containing protein [Candidatus Babeliaceae bacterium]|jgi:ABC-type lipoprotein export system ATPase subunit